MRMSCHGDASLSTCVACIDLQWLMEQGAGEVADLPKMLQVAEDIYEMSRGARHRASSVRFLPRPRRKPRGPKGTRPVVKRGVAEGHPGAADRRPPSQVCGAEGGAPVSKGGASGRGSPGDRISRLSADCVGMSCCIGPVFCWRRCPEVRCMGFKMTSVIATLGIRAI